ncbi:hypothetical protein BE15_14960 [Sorangium cellulosum]|uniref:Uncharacterized protein n=1 Tax=Sorangium cellulosum TaxID=56 RepID=A0A150QI61_SORCE|nr:hypothetical protein BE15_14960 [Sorangium cellulosum]
MFSHENAASSRRLCDGEQHAQPVARTATVERTAMTRNEEHALLHAGIDPSADERTHQAMAEETASWARRPLSSSPDRPGAGLVRPRDALRA